MERVPKERGAKTKGRGEEEKEKKDEQPKTNDLRK